MSMKRMLYILSTIAVTLGIAAMMPFMYLWFQKKQALASAAPTMAAPAVAPAPTPKPDLVSGEPVRIQIPSLKIDLAVIDGAYNPKNGEWTLTLNKAQYALPTVQPNNEEGNTLIYGHYRPEVFAYLHLIKPGAEIDILTANGYRFVYTYQNTQAYSPEDTSVFSYQGAPRLTIQTCSGAWMQNRQMYYSTFTRYEKL